MRRSPELASLSRDHHQTLATALDVLHELGTCLAAHVRLEERELFPLIERTMPAAPLTAVAAALEHAGHA